MSQQELFTNLEYEMREFIGEQKFATLELWFKILDEIIKTRKHLGLK